MHLFKKAPSTPSKTRKKAFDAAPEWKRFAIMVVVVEVTIRDGIDDVYDERRPTLGLLPRYLIPLGNDGEDFIVKDSVNV